MVAFLKRAWRLVPLSLRLFLLNHPAVRHGVRAARRAITAERLPDIGQLSGELPPPRLSPGPQRPAMSNLRRLRGVHYFQRTWSYLFWDSVDLSMLDEDFALIRGHGFNTILLMQSWGMFQPRTSPPAYDEQMFAKLDAIVAAAARHGLWVIVRVGTPEHPPADFAGSRNFFLPDVMFSERQLAALHALFAETSRRLARHANVFGLFHSWEDFAKFLVVIGQGEQQRLAFEDRHGRFRAYLRERAPLEHWNQRWQTSYASFEEIPLPAVGTRTLVDYIDFVSEYINAHVLAPNAVSPGVELGYELRLEQEPVMLGDRYALYGYQRGFQLPPNYTFRAAYFNPYWGAPNQGDFLPPEQALANLQLMHSFIEAAGPGAPLFFDQLNLADDTPAFAATNTRLRYPHDEARAVRLIVPYLLQHTLGYSIWTFRDYVANVLRDPRFSGAPAAWSAEGAELAGPGPAGARPALLPPGAALEQAFAGDVNPGWQDEAAFHFDAVCAVEGGDGRPQRLEVVVRTAGGAEVRRRIVVAARAPHRHDALLPELVSQLPCSIRIAAAPENTAAVALAEARLWNHKMATGFVDDEGRLKRSRSLAYAAVNRWAELYETGQALPAHAGTWVTADSLRGAGVTPDGWVGARLVASVYVPFPSGTIRLSATVPAGAPLAEQAHLSVTWTDAEPDIATRTFPLRHGANDIDIPIVPRSGGSTLGDRRLLICAGQTYRLGADSRTLAYNLIGLGTQPRTVRAGDELAGRYLLRLPDARANRAVVYGSAEGGGVFHVTFHVRGHPPVSVWIDGGSAEWRAELPLWRELMLGLPDVYIEAARVEGGGRLVLAGVQTDAERSAGRPPARRT